MTLSVLVDPGKGSHFSVMRRESAKPGLEIRLLEARAEMRLQQSNEWGHSSASNFEEETYYCEIEFIFDSSCILFNQIIPAKYQTTDGTMPIVYLNTRNPLRPFPLICVRRAS
jgi:hypothetical protein